MEVPAHIEIPELRTQNMQINRILPTFTKEDGETFQRLLKDRDYGALHDVLDYFAEQGTEPYITGELARARASSNPERVDTGKSIDLLVLGDTWQLAHIDREFTAAARVDGVNVQGPIGEAIGALCTYFKAPPERNHGQNIWRVRPIGKFLRPYRSFMIRFDDSENPKYLSDR